MRRAVRLLLLGIFLLLGCVSLLRWGSARAVAVVQGALLTAPRGEGRTLLWIEQDAKGDRLVLHTGRRASRSLLSAPSLGGLALLHGRALTTERAADGPVRLLSVDTRTGAQQTLTTLAAPACALVADGTWVCGVSRGEPALPGVPFVVAAGAPTAVWAVPSGGGRPIVLSRSLGGAEEDLDLLGLASGQLYWVAWQTRRGGQLTTILRSRLPGGPVETVAVEEGRQSAVLLPGRLAWTCFSPEAAAPTQFRGVKVQPWTGGKARVVADWLSSETQLLASGDRLYAEGPDGLWQLGEARGEQRFLRTSGRTSQPPVAIDGVEYLTEVGRQTQVLARGLSWPRTLQLSLGL